MKSVYTYKACLVVSIYNDSELLLKLFLIGMLIFSVLCDSCLMYDYSNPLKEFSTFHCIHSMWYVICVQIPHNSVNNSLRLHRYFCLVHYLLILVNLYSY